MAGQEYNHDLLACETGRTRARCRRAASLCPVDAAGHAVRAEAARATRWRPAGPGRRGAAAGVTARLRDLGGRAAGEARLSLFTGITGGRSSPG